MPQFFVKGTHLAGFRDKMKLTKCQAEELARKIDMKNTVNLPEMQRKVNANKERYDAVKNSIAMRREVSVWLVSGWVVLTRTCSRSLP